MDMGPMGAYEFLRHAGRAPAGSPMGQGMLGAVMKLMPGQPSPAWTFYFRVPDIDVAVAHVHAHGGRLVQEPTEIPGGDFSFVAVDPQGATFGLVGSRRK
jgi:predicted enzyme related to lactoylglutathione lyase